MAEAAAKTRSCSSRTTTSRWCRDDPGEAAGGDHPHVLAHPLAEPGAFGICPWRREILEGMLGSTILGFHTRFHCKNFLETVDRFLEARIEHEHSTISSRRATTLVERYPISIEWPRRRPRRAGRRSRQCRARVFARLGLAAGQRARRRRRPLRLHQGHPGAAARGRAAAREAARSGSAASASCRSPRRRAARSRSTARSRSASSASAERINQRFGQRRLPAGDPARRSTTTTRRVNELYRAADVCLVTSLHDGMNLVAKEFVAARDDEQGVLILSRFAGAARELHRGADRQSLPRRGMRRCAARRR